MKKKDIIVFFKIEKKNVWINLERTEIIEEKQKGVFYELLC